jgi:hypothetical protein
MATTPVQTKYDLIRQQEELLAYALAKAVIEKPKASLWIIFLPIFFVFHAQRMQKYKKSVHAFARQFLHTKLLALDAARDEAATGRPPEGYPGDAAPPGKENEGNARIRRNQLREIALLREHYLLLLQSEGETYPELLRGAYGTGGKYRFFLNRLFAAEAAVNAAVLDAHHSTPESREVVTRMVAVTERLREKTMAEIFG